MVDCKLIYKIRESEFKFNNIYRVHVYPHLLAYDVHITYYHKTDKELRDHLYHSGGDGGIVPFEPFFHAFPGGLDKATIKRISLVLPSRKEKREIIFPFRRDHALYTNSNIFTLKLRKYLLCYFKNHTYTIQDSQKYNTTV